MYVFLVFVYVHWTPDRVRFIPGDVDGRPSAHLWHLTPFSTSTSYDGNDTPTSTRPTIFSHLYYKISFTLHTHTHTNNVKNKIKKKRSIRKIEYFWLFVDY